MIKAIKIWLHRAEGKEDFATVEGEDVWFEAQNVLRRWGRTAPKPGGGYDKTDFKVTFEDGETYEGRFDLQFGGFDGGQTLSQHVHSYVAFYALVNRPAHFNDENWALHYDRQKSCGDDQQCLEWLKKYDLGIPARSYQQVK